MLLQMCQQVVTCHVGTQGRWFLLYSHFVIAQALAASRCSRCAKGTPECAAAQRGFVESMAGYSLVCYLLAMKDRHNGNILLDDAGHVVHIDFGFMLSNSPGGVNFESAPFKLTRELLELMDSDSEGSPSQLFDYFKVALGMRPVLSKAGVCVDMTRPWNVEGRTAFA